MSINYFWKLQDGQYYDLHFTNEETVVLKTGAASQAFDLGIKLKEIPTVSLIKMFKK
jgi:hypothetical protein